MTQRHAAESAPGVTGRRVVVVDHHDSYTYNLVHLAAAVTGALPEVVEHDETSVDDLSGFSHIVLSPGPGNPDDERDFSVGRRVLLEATVPVLGVCLGMQGMVSVYGGLVRRIEPAHGEVAAVTHDGSGIFDGVPSPFAAVRYHSLAAVTVPDVLRANAWCDTAAGPVVMGVVHREKPQWGVQFHPESILTEHGAVMMANFLGLR
ncbi:MAG TPA: aminodeoxychorismate/anthranilate synthase component II [Nocardioidaceae bacterium]|nr:aminodeoxychorismate/anthranilate synthase component II [Nocardioidaceae bacterium]